MKIKKAQLMPVDNGTPGPPSEPHVNPPEAVPKPSPPVSSGTVKVKSKSKKLQPNSVGSLNASTTTSSPVPTTQKRTKRRKKQSTSPSTTSATTTKDGSLKRRRVIKDTPAETPNNTSSLNNSLVETSGLTSNSTSTSATVTQKSLMLKMDETDDFTTFFDLPQSAERQDSDSKNETVKSEKECNPMSIVDSLCASQQPNDCSVKKDDVLDDNYPYIHVFTTNLANAGAEALQNGKSSSLIGFHKETKGDPAQILMEKEKQMRREANLAKLKQIGGMLNIYSSKKRPSETPKPPTNGQLDDRKKPRSSTLNAAPRMHRAGPPERFGSLTDFSRRNPPPISYGGPSMAELQTAPSPQHMNYEIHGQELIITRQLNPRHKPNTNDSNMSTSPMIQNRDQMAEPLSHMLHMTNNIPRPASDPKRMSSPSVKSDIMQQHTPQRTCQPHLGPPRPRMMYMDAPPPSVIPSSGHFGNAGGGCHPPRMMMGPPPHHHHAPVNNTFVNATMSIQQLNIQSMPDGSGQHPQQLVMAASGGGSGGCGGGGGGGGPPHHNLSQHGPHSYMVPMDHQQQMMTMPPPPPHRMPFNPMMRPRCMGPPQQQQQQRFRPHHHHQMDGIMMTPSPASMMGKQFMDPPPPSNGTNGPMMPMMQRMMMSGPPSQMMMMSGPPQRFMYCGAQGPPPPMMEMRPPGPPMNHPEQMMMSMDHSSSHHLAPQHFHGYDGMMDGPAPQHMIMQPHHQMMVDSSCPPPPSMSMIHQQGKPQQRMMPLPPQQHQMFHPNDYGQMYVDSAHSQADLMNSPAFMPSQPQHPSQPPPPPPQAAEQFMNSGTCNQ
ncbi:hypothetical protein ACOME3_002099 [Neoechinorhynchus agilis]